MKRLAIAALTVGLIGAAAATAQEHPRPAAHEPAPLVQPPDNASPQLWLYYQQLQRHDDPQLAVRRRAEFKAEQRQNRMATRRWFGISASRPPASPTPFTGSYSPYWAGGGLDPNAWTTSGGSRPAYAAEPYGPWRY